MRAVCQFAPFPRACAVSGGDIFLFMTRFKLSSPFSLSFSPSLFLNICPDLRHFLIIPILIPASVNEPREWSCRVFQCVGLMWELQEGKFGNSGVTLRVHYCVDVTF